MRTCKKCGGNLSVIMLSSGMGVSCRNCNIRVVVSKELLNTMYPQDLLEQAFDKELEKRGELPCKPLPLG